MKKYITPAMTIVTTKRCHLLAGSMRVSSEYIGSGTVLAPESDFDWDDE